MNPIDSPNRQRLLIVITKSNFGGAQRYVYDLSRSLKDRYDVVVACGGNGMLRGMLGSAGVRIVPIPSLDRDVNVFKDIRSLFTLAKIMRTERPDIIHLNSSKTGGLGSVAARLFAPQALIVFTAHAWAFNEDRNIVSKWLISALHWTTVMLAHRTIAVSSSVKRQMAHLPFMDRKIRVVHLGLESFEPASRADARALLGIKGDSLAICSIAELHPVKGLEYALQAIRQASFDCTYTIIGDGQLRRRLETTIASDPVLKKRVRLTGFIPNAAKLMSAFDIFLLPSLSEAFGYVLLEAGYCKVPVIATSVGGIPEIIEDMKSGILIHPKNAKEIKRSLEFLAESSITRDDLALELSNKVRAEFSLDEMIEKTAAIYEPKRRD